MAYTRECLLCRKKYEYCYCNMNSPEDKWKMLFHDNNCRTIYNTLQKYSTKEITVKEAIAILDKCDLTVVENAAESVKKDLAIILAQKEEVKPVESKPVTEKVSTKKLKQINNDNN